MNQRKATQLAHALVWRLFANLDPQELRGFPKEDRTRILSALDQLRQFHYTRTGDWIDPGRPFPRPPQHPDLFRQDLDGQLWIF